MLKYNKHLPYGRQFIDDDDIEAVAKSLRGELITTGPLAEAFEQKFAEKVGAKHAVVCNSGTAALHLASMVNNVKKGDWVIVPTNTFAATANAPRLLGAEIVFADVDPNSGLLTAQSFFEALKICKSFGKKPRALYVVHYAGYPVRIDNISDLLSNQNISIIEDACHALGTKYSSECGPISIGDCRHNSTSTFSFHPVKTITTGEGGMITTNNFQIAEKLRVLRSHGIYRKNNLELLDWSAIDKSKWEDPWYYEMHDLSPNYRLPDILCALGISQLSKLDWFSEKRRALVSHYDFLFERFSSVVKIRNKDTKCSASPHIYYILVDFEALATTRKEFMQKLLARGVGSQVHYIPVHTQPYYRKRYGRISLPGSEKFYSQVISLPLYPEMNYDDVERVVESVVEILVNK